MGLFEFVLQTLGALLYTWLPMSACSSYGMNLATSLEGVVVISTTLLGLDAKVESGIVGKW